MTMHQARATAGNCGDASSDAWQAYPAASLAWIPLPQLSRTTAICGVAQSGIALTLLFFKRYSLVLYCSSYATERIFVHKIYPLYWHRRLRLLALHLSTHRLTYAPFSSTYYYPRGFYFYDPADIHTGLGYREGRETNTIHNAKPPVDNNGMIGVIKIKRSISRRELEKKSVHFICNLVCLYEKALRKELAKACRDDQPSSWRRLGER